MTRRTMAVVHDMAGRIVAVCPTTAAADGVALEGIAVGGEGETVVITEVEEDDIAELSRTHVVLGAELRAREDGGAAG